MINCWEYKKCGREPGGKKCTEKGICPAAITQKYNLLNNGVNGGRICWAVAGTLCNDTVQGIFALKIDSCLNCDFFKLVADDEKKEFILRPPEVFECS